MAHQQRFTHIALVGLSGAGKSTLSKAIIKNCPEEFAISKSYTTRLPRGSEIKNVEYYNIPVKQFQNGILLGSFLEWNRPYGTDYYGTAHQVVASIIRSGRSAIFDIDIDGANALKKCYGDMLLRIFVGTPLETVEKWLRNRGDVPEEKIRTRIARGKNEEYPRMHEMDYILDYGEGFDPNIVANKLVNLAFIAPHIELKATGTT